MKSRFGREEGEKKGKRHATSSSRLRLPQSLLRISLSPFLHVSSTRLGQPPPSTARHHQPQQRATRLTPTSPPTAVLSSPACLSLTTPAPRTLLSLHRLSQSQTQPRTSTPTLSASSPSNVGASYSSWPRSPPPLADSVPLLSFGSSSTLNACSNSSLRVQRRIAHPSP
mgnify:CR=1 FL=1